MNYAVIGGRNFKDWFYFTNVMAEFNPSAIISGGAKGADLMAKKYAKMKSIPYIEFLPDWDTYGKKAGFLRNHDIICACDEVIAFWDGESTGTRHSINLAKNQKKKVHIYWSENGG